MSWLCRLFRCRDRETFCVLLRIAGELEKQTPILREIRDRLPPVPTKPTGIDVEFKPNQ